MGFGLKKLFKNKGKKNSKAPKTPKSKARSPVTPQTQPATSEPTVPLVTTADLYSEDLPVRNLLDDLNIHADGLNGDTELVLGELPSDVPDDQDALSSPMVSTVLGEGDYTREHPFKEDSPVDETATAVGADSPSADVATIAQESLIDDKSEASPLAPRRLDGDTVDEIVRKTESQDDGAAEVEAVATTKAEEVKEETGADAPATPLAGTETQTETPSADTTSKVEDKAVAVTITQTPATVALTPDGTKTPQSHPDDEKISDDLKQRLVTMFNSATQSATEFASSLNLPEPIQKLVPTVDNVLCQPLTGTRSDLSHGKEKVKLQRQYSYYDEQFALKFLDELLNVGYALVNHEQLVDDLTDEATDGDWVGRSVTLILRPGVCNAVQVRPPCLEWATMGGGQRITIETTTISLLDIYSIATSDIDATSDDPESEEEVQCFFTLTTKSGQVFVMEAITADESQRLVAGVKNLVSRLTRQLIRGDETLLSDFFDNADEPDDIRFGSQEALVRLSHFVLDAL